MSASSGVPDPDTTDVVGSRIWAQVIDVALHFVQLFVVGLFLAWLADPRSSEEVEFWVYAAALTLPLYGGLLEGLWNGQTVGKRLLDIQVVDRRGETPTVGQALFRNLPAVLVFSWLTTVVALAAIATDDRRQRLFDRLPDTYVVDAVAVRAARAPDWQSGGTG